MTFNEIRSYEPINHTSDNKVNSLVESIRDNGWSGCPILVSEHMESLVTGSHRLEALNAICRDLWAAEEYEENHGNDIEEEVEVAENVDDILEEYLDNNDLSWDDFDTLPFDTLHLIFAGTWVENYKNELEEW